MNRPPTVESVDRLIEAIRHADAGLKSYEGVSLVWAMEGANWPDAPEKEYKESIEIIKKITGDEE